MSSYPTCGQCGEGVLLPVDMGGTSDRKIKYRCTNPDCCARFDEYGYERFDLETQTWQRLTEA